MFLETISFAFMSIIAAKMSKKHPHSAALGGILGLSLTFLFVYYNPSFTSFILFAISVGLFSAFAFNPVYVHAVRRLPKGSEGFGINLIDVIINSAFLASIFFDIIASRIGIHITLLIASLCSLTGFILSSLILIKSGKICI